MLIDCIVAFVHSVVDAVDFVVDVVIEGCCTYSIYVSGYLCTGRAFVNPLKALRTWPSERSRYLI